MLTEPDARYQLTIPPRRPGGGRGDPLPAAPATTLTTDTWKARRPLGVPAAALGEGRLQASDLPAAIRFLGLFRTGT
ncbi:MAG: hypothetical protein R3F43_09155 [bacterium]